MDCIVECFVGLSRLGMTLKLMNVFQLFTYWTGKLFKIYRVGCARNGSKETSICFVQRVPSGFLLNLSCIIYTPEANWFIYLFRRWNNHHVWCSFLCAWLFSEGVLALLLFGGDETREGWNWRKKLSLTTAWSSGLERFKGSLMWSGKRWCASDYSVWWHI